jgi:hypothetical protein
MSTILFLQSLNCYGKLLVSPPLSLILSDYLPAITPVSSILTSTFIMATAWNLHFITQTG